ncbi:MAG: hypothetical protein ACI3XW_08550, partial [Butyricicoccus sp.]
MTDHTSRFDGLDDDAKQASSHTAFNFNYYDQFFLDANMRFCYNLPQRCPKCDFGGIPVAIPQYFYQYHSIL